MLAINCMKCYFGDVSHTNICREIFTQIMSSLLLTRSDLNRCYIERGTWWSRQIETFPALLALCAGNSPHKGQWREAFMFFLICLNKRLSKQSWRRWFDTPWRSLWRPCNAIFISGWCFLLTAIPTPGKTTLHLNKSLLIICCDPPRAIRVTVHKIFHNIFISRRYIPCTRSDYIAFPPDYIYVTCNFNGYRLDESVSVIRTLVHMN